ncbi:hypothetical protein DPMN_073761 [Dreissena polymorpha]|uniref:Uncharacterized protein n=1 Tax=Dreissena polymorpha TaxID=45954 RepID=A0A9D4BZS3_DREPO|nr:hypothetical protein DPMN_073761 [Dreissena polymorpha]
MKTEPRLPQQIFELNREVIRTSVLTAFNLDSTKNVTSGVLTRFHYTITIFDLSQDIIRRTNLTKIGAYIKLTRPTGGHVFQSINTIFKPVQDVIKHVLTEFH